MKDNFSSRFKKKVRFWKGRRILLRIILITFVFVLDPDPLSFWILAQDKIAISTGRTGSKIFSHVHLCGGWIVVCSLCRQTGAYCRIGARPWIVSLWDVTRATRRLCRMWAHSNVKAWFYGSLSRDEKRATLCCTPIKARGTKYGNWLSELCVVHLGFVLSRYIFQSRKRKNW